MGGRTLYIELGSPWENGYIESFNGKLRDELLAREVFYTLREVRVLEEGGIEGFLRREVLPYAPDAWYDPGGVKVGYEISFTRNFYRPQPLRDPDEIWADIRALEADAEGLLEAIRGGV